MKRIFLLLTIVFSLIMTSCAVVPARYGYYSHYEEGRMNPGTFYSYDGFYPRYFHDYDRGHYRYHDHDHDDGFGHSRHYDHRSGYDRGHDNDHNHNHN